MESLEIIFSQYKETCEALLDYTKIWWEDIKDYYKKAIGNLLHANIDDPSRRLISELPVDGVKCISKLQSYCANMNFSDKSIYDRIFQQVTHKGGLLYQDILKQTGIISFSGKHLLWGSNDAYLLE